MNIPWRKWPVTILPIKQILKAMTCKTAVINLLLPSTERFYKVLPLRKVYQNTEGENHILTSFLSGLAKKMIHSAMLNFKVLHVTALRADFNAPVLTIKEIPRL